MDELREKILQFGLDCMGYVGDKAIERITRRKASAAFVEPQLDEIMALIDSYGRELQIDDREVLIGMFEANKDNISVGEIIATLKGQVKAIEEGK